jgi:uncharacterized protein
MTDHVIHPELAEHIRVTPLADTHEHQYNEEGWINDGPADVLVDLLTNYVTTDLYCAHSGQQALDDGQQKPEMDIRDRWKALEKAWNRIRTTGYAEAISHQAKVVYGIEEITADAMIAAQPILDNLRKPGERLRMLKEVANIDHMQIDGGLPLPVDTGGADFFLHDISWFMHSSGQPNLEAISKDTGKEISDLAGYKRFMEDLFAKYAPYASGVKSQHAYVRSLKWERRDDADAEAIVQKILRGDETTEADKLCLGDWAWARGVELATEHDLPFKMHTGFYAGADNMLVDRIRSGHLGTIAMAYPDAKFVCMHMAYPYEGELIAMTKQFRNIYADMCWGWSINPYAGMQFVRSFLHACAVNNLFIFGGDTHCVTGTVGYALQARQWLARALTAEINDGFMTLDYAKWVAEQVMYKNQRECFPIDRAQENIRKLE